MTYFPFNYLSVMCHPVKLFMQRFGMTWWQKGILLLVITSLMMLPFASQLGAIDQVSLYDYTNGIFEEISDEDLNVFNQSLLNGQVEESKVSELESTIITITSNDQLTQIDSGTSGIWLAPNGFLIQEEERPAIYVSEVNSLQYTQSETPQALVAQLSHYWLQQYRIAIVLSNYLNVSLLVMISVLFLVMGTSVILWLAAKGPFFTFETFRESVQFSLNVLGLPTCVAILIGFIQKNSNAVLLTQQIVYILWLLLVYYKTHFNDQYVQAKYSSLQN